MMAMPVHSLLENVWPNQMLLRTMVKNFRVVVVTDSVNDPKLLMVKNMNTCTRESDYILKDVNTKHEHF